MQAPRQVLCWPSGGDCHTDTATGSCAGLCRASAGLQRAGAACAPAARGAGRLGAGPERLRWDSLHLHSHHIAQSLLTCWRMPLQARQPTSCCRRTACAWTPLACSACARQAPACTRSSLSARLGRWSPPFRQPWSTALPLLRGQAQLLMIVRVPAEPQTRPGKSHLVLGPASMVPCLIHKEQLPAGWAPSVLPHRAWAGRRAPAGRRSPRSELPWRLQGSSMQTCCA